MSAERSGVLIAGSCVVLTRILKLPWKRTTCGVLGYGCLLVAWILSRAEKSREVIDVLRTTGYVFLLGTPSYERVRDGFLVSGVLMALARRPEALAPMTALYYATGVPSSSTTFLTTLRTVFVLSLMLGARNPLVA